MLLRVYLISRSLLLLVALVLPVSLPYQTKCSRSWLSIANAGTRWLYLPTSSTGLLLFDTLQVAPLSPDWATKMR